MSQATIAISPTATGSSGDAGTRVSSATTSARINTGPQNSASCVWRGSQNRGESRLSAAVPKIRSVATVLTPQFGTGARTIESRQENWMASFKPRVEAGLRRLERKIGIDREGRTVWVWLLPPGIGLVTAALVPFMPGLPDAMGLFDRLTLAVFGMFTM